MISTGTKIFAISNKITLVMWNVRGLGMKVTELYKELKKSKRAEEQTRSTQKQKAYNVYLQRGKKSCREIYHMSQNAVKAQRET